jgi:hypothetical protein
MDVNILIISEYLTFRNVILVIFCLPLVTMLVTLPFLSLLSKSTKEWLELLGFFGAIANSVIVIELGFRTIAEVIYYSTQKPQYFSEITNERMYMVKRYEPFDAFALKYLVVFLIITISTWVMMDIYSTKKKFGRAGKPYSEKNPLNLSE